MNDYRKKLLFSNQIVKLIKDNLSENEYIKMTELIEKMRYEDVNIILKKIIKDKCVQIY